MLRIYPDVRVRLHIEAEIEEGAMIAFVALIVGYVISAQAGNKDLDEVVSSLKALRVRRFADVVSRSARTSAHPARAAPRSSRATPPPPKPETWSSASATSSFRSNPCGTDPAISAATCTRCAYSLVAGRAENGSRNRLRGSTPCSAARRAPQQQNRQGSTPASRCPMQHTAAETPNLRAQRAEAMSRDVLADAGAGHGAVRAHHRLGSRGRHARRGWDARCGTRLRTAGPTRPTSQRTRSRSSGWMVRRWASIVPSKSRGSTPWIEWNSSLHCTAPVRRSHNQLPTLASASLSRTRVSISARLACARRCSGMSRATITAAPGHCSPS